MNLNEKLRIIPDYPKKGINFVDITPVLADGEALRDLTEKFTYYTEKLDADIIVGPEARGFLLGTPVAYNLSKGFVPVRKKGKLPAETISESYELEYGTDILEMHKDAIKPGQRVVIVDDLLATGGTVKAIISLIEQLGGIVAGLVFFIELEELKGRELFKDYPVYSIITRK